MVKLVGWCESVQSGSQKSHGRGISIKVRLAIANKKIHPPFHLAHPTYSTFFAKIPPPKKWSMRDVTLGVFFLVPIHGEGITKKNPSRWIIKIFLEVLNLQKKLGGLDIFRNLLYLLVGQIVGPLCWPYERRTQRSIKGPYIGPIKKSKKCLESEILRASSWSINHQNAPSIRGAMVFLLILLA